MIKIQASIVSLCKHETKPTSVYQVHLIFLIGGVFFTKARYKSSFSLIILLVHVPVLIYWETLITYNFMLRSTNELLVCMIND